MIFWKSSKGGPGGGSFSIQNLCRRFWELSTGLFEHEIDAKNTRRQKEICSNVHRNILNPCSFERKTANILEYKLRYFFSNRCHDKDRKKSVITGPLPAKLQKTHLYTSFYATLVCCKVHACTTQGLHQVACFELEEQKAAQIELDQRRPIRRLPSMTK